MGLNESIQQFVIKFYYRKSLYLKYYLLQENARNTLLVK